MRRQLHDPPGTVAGHFQLAHVAVKLRIVDFDLLGGKLPLGQLLVEPFAVGADFDRLGGESIRLPATSTVETTRKVAFRGVRSTRVVDRGGAGGMGDGPLRVERLGDDDRPGVAAAPNRNHAARSLAAALIGEPSGDEAAISPDSGRAGAGRAGHARIGS